MNNRLVIRSSDIFAGITTFLLATYLFQCNYLYDIAVVSFIRRSAILVAALYVVAYMVSSSKKGYTLKIKSNALILLVALYSVVKLYSNYRSGNLSLTSFMEIIDVFLLFAVLDVSSKKHRLKSAILGIAIYMLLICVTNDIIWVLKGFQPFEYGDAITGALNIYFIGNKFSTTYYHMICFALWIMIYERRYKKLSVILFGIWILIISFGLDCSTAIVGTIVLIAMLIMNEKQSEFFKKRYVIAIALLFSALFPFFVDSLLNVEFIQNIVTKLLSRNLTLTGRTNIFSSIFKVISINPIWGNGSSTSDVILDIAGAANIQNAFWQIIISYGIVGVALLIAIIFVGTANHKNESHEINSYVSLTLIYVFIIMGCVEITYGTDFLIFVAIYHAVVSKPGTKKKLNSRR